MEELLAAVAGFLMIFVAVAIAIYIACSIFLNKFHKLVEGKGTIAAWIPIANVYVLGKLTFNKTVGWVLVICSLLTGSYSTTINDVTKTKTFLPGIVSDVYGIAVFILFIYAIVKYNKLKKAN